MSDEYKYPGQLEVSSIVVRSSTGKELDILSHIVEINIYESLYSNTVSANLVIADSGGLAARLPLIGFELVTFGIKSPTDKETKQLVFYVYKISERKYVNQKFNGYVLQLISNEAIVDQNTSFSKSYKGTHSDIVKRIFFDSFSGSTKLLELDSCESATVFINPYWNPFSAINWIANKAIGKEKMPSYFFYETLDGFKFKNFYSLCQAESEMDYINRPTKINIDDSLGEKMKTIVDFKVIESASTMEMLMRGTFGSRIFIKDINENSYIRKDFDYTSAFQKVKKLNENLIKPNLDAFGQSLENVAVTKVAGMTSNAYSSTEDNCQFGQWVLERKSLIEQLCATKIELFVHGNVNITTGKTVNLIIPEASDQNRIDPFLSGKYIISSIRHVISQGKKHMMVLEVLKDSFASNEHLKILGDRKVKYESSRASK